MRFPSEVNQLTPELLTAALSVRRPGVVVVDVEVAATKYAGEGVASTADRVVLDVSYGPDTPPDLPTRLILKTMLVGPHAPPTMYENEVRFYNEVRHELEVEAPLVYGCHAEPGSGHFGLLLEDLNARRARFPRATERVDVGEITSLLDQLARVHAHFWKSPRLQTDLSWVPTPIAGGMADVFNDFGRDLAQSQVDLHSFKAEMIAPLKRSVPELWDLLTRVRSEQATLPATLLHGDPHIGNTYLLPGQRGGLLDWQLVTRGSFAHDVIYLLVTGLPPDERRHHQRDLIAYYLDRLAHRGVTDPPDTESAWHLCRKAALWGLVIGWLLCPPANYGEAVTRENIGRTVEAICDLDTLSLIES